MNDPAIDFFKAGVESAIGKPLENIMIQYAGKSLEHVSAIGDGYFRMVKTKCFVLFDESLARFMKDRPIRRKISDRLLLNCVSSASVEDNSILRDAFARLIAKAATTTGAEDPYHVFADMLRGLTPKQAEALRDAYRTYLDKYTEAEEEHARSESFEEFFPFIPVENFFPEEGRNLTLANLKRLGILEFIQEADVNLYAYVLTDLGLQFIETCLPEKPV